MSPTKKSQPGGRNSGLAPVAQPVTPQEHALRTICRTPGRDRDQIVRARSLWALMGRDDAKVEEAMGLNPGQVELWRTKLAPDGMDWDQFAERLGLADAADMVQIVGPQDEFSLAANNIRVAQKIMASSLSVMDGGRLYDENGNLVEHLYDYEGKKVPVGGLRPRSFGEAATGIKWASQVQSENFEVLRRLSDFEGQVKRDREAMVQQVFAAVQRAFGPDAMGAFLQAAQSVGMIPGGTPQAAAVVDVAEDSEPVTEEQPNDEEEEEPDAFGP